MERNDRIEDELFPFYALDALTDDERAEVDAYVAANPAARDRLSAALADAAALVELSAPLAPAPEVKARLMARVAADADAATSMTADGRPPTAEAAKSAMTADRRPPTAEAAKSAMTADRRPPTAKAAPSGGRRFGPRDFFLGRALGFAVLLLLLGAFGLWRLWSQSNDLQAQVATLEQSNAQLQAELDQARSVNTLLLDVLAGRDETLAYLTQPGAVTFALSDPSGARPAAAGTVTTTADGAVTLAVMNLPPPEADQTYQAWLIVGDTPISAGTFAVDVTGRALLTLSNPPADAFDAFGVSLEPAGGSETPTEIVLLGAGA